MDSNNDVKNHKNHVSFFAKNLYSIKSICDVWMCLILSLILLFPMTYLRILSLSKVYMSVWMFRGYSTLLIFQNDLLGGKVPITSSQSPRPSPRAFSLPWQYEVLSTFTCWQRWDHDSHSLQRITGRDTSYWPNASWHLQHWSPARFDEYESKKTLSQCTSPVYTQSFQVYRHFIFQRDRFTFNLE